MLAFCAFGAQARPPGRKLPTTTVFECSKSATTLDFADAHCDNMVTGGGTFGPNRSHPLRRRKIETTNTETKNNTTEVEPLMLKGELLGATVKITCKMIEPDRAATSFVKNINLGDFEATAAVNVHRMHAGKERSA